MGADAASDPHVKKTDRIFSGKSPLQPGGEWGHGSWGLPLGVTYMLKKQIGFFRQVAPATWGEWEHGSWGVIEKNRSDFFSASRPCNLGRMGSRPSQPRPVRPHLESRSKVCRSVVAINWRPLVGWSPLIGDHLHWLGGRHLVGDHWPGGRH